MAEKGILIMKVTNTHWRADQRNLGSTISLDHTNPLASRVLQVICDVGRAEQQGSVTKTADSMMASSSTGEQVWRFQQEVRKSHV